MLGEERANVLGAQAGFAQAPAPLPVQFATRGLLGGAADPGDPPAGPHGVLDLALLGLGDGLPHGRELHLQVYGEHLETRQIGR